MIPELLISTFVSGNSAATRPVNASTDAGSSTSGVIAWIPLFPQATSSSASLRLPATIARFPAPQTPRPTPARSPTRRP